MSEWRLFEPGTVPGWTTSEWYAGRDRAPHVDQEEHRGRLDLAANMALQTLASGRSLVDLGCGDGGLLWLLGRWLGRSVPMWGYDLQPSNIEPAVTERGVDVRYGDVVAGDIEWADAAVATEMLEHLLDPHEFVRRIAEHSRWLVASSPFTERPGAAYEFHTWAWDQDGYRALMEQAGFTVVRHETTSIFQVVLAAR